MLQDYGLWVLIVVLLGVGAFWAWQRFVKVAEKQAEKTLEEIVEQSDKNDEFAQATTRYLRAVVEEYRFCKFRGQGARTRGIEPPELDRVYVSLKVQPESKAKERAAKNNKRENISDEGGLEMRDVQPIDLADAMKRTSKVAIVGAAGSGKSTLLQWAGLALARVRLDKSKLTDEQKEFVSAASPETKLLPVLIALRDYNRYCREKKLTRTAQSLLQFMGVYFAEQYPTLKLPDNFFASYMGAQGAGCLLMFDGVDEVATEDRQFVREAIEDLLTSVGGANPRNRYLVTSRTVAYFGAATVSGFAECLVQNLSPVERDRLIHSWYATVYAGEKAKKRAEDLCNSIATSDERVKGLAVTPLMVTIFALVHFDDNKLPRQRAALYERATETLLTESGYKEGEAVRDLEKWGGKDPKDRRNRLARIAFLMHDLPKQQGDEMAEDDLVELIWADFGSEKNSARPLAREFIELVAERGGLLERRGNAYGFFTHRTFREFLAGRYLAEEMQDNWAQVLASRFMDDHWREPILLAAGFLAGGESRANQFIRLLADLGVTLEEKTKALALAGWAFADLLVDDENLLHPKRIETRDLLRPEMLKTLTANPPVVSPVFRRDLGLALSAIGDPRLAQPIWERTDYFITIDPGTFQMGTTEDEAKRLKEQGAGAYSNELYPHTVYVSAFGMGKYPVTNADYRLFLNATQENYADWFSEPGKRWVEGTLEADLSFLGNDEGAKKFYRDWLENRPKDKRRQPFWWDDPQWNADSLPVIGVSWFEAEAYCNWLTVKLREANAITSEQKIHLPTEAQWEKSARAQRPTSNLQPLTSNLWSWGDTWDKDKCNSEASGFRSTTPVGMYPDGASSYGVEDMMGNVWEWCNDGYDEKIYQSRQGQEVRDPQGALQGSARVVRGGSWLDFLWSCRAAYRFRLTPLPFNNNLGFRLALSPIKFLDS
jgi:formylglycine-generating enzyme required for sulfatase activity